MSISTQTGDDGTTGPLFGKRVAKTDPRIACNGALDELGAHLGLARAHLRGTPGEPFITEGILAIQQQFVGMMGEIATLPEDRERYRLSGMAEVGAAMVDALTARVVDLEKNHKIEFHRWATPGETLASAALEVARTVCRRAERAVQALRDAEAGASGTLGSSGHPPLNPEIPRYLNRLSDLLWLWARWMETRECGGAP